MVGEGKRGINWLFTAGFQNFVWDGTTLSVWPDFRYVGFSLTCVTDGAGIVPGGKYLGCNWSSHMDLEGPRIFKTGLAPHFVLRGAQTWVPGTCHVYRIMSAMHVAGYGTQDL